MWILCLIIGSLQPVTKYMLVARPAKVYPVDYHSHELITLMFVILACMCICRPIDLAGLGVVPVRMTGI